MKLVTVSEMKAIEAQADAGGLPYAQMMENAGRGLAELIHDLKADTGWEEVIGLVGPGNNGGDTLVALAHLARAGWRARAYCVKRKTKNDPLIEHLVKSGGEFLCAEDDDEAISLAAFIESADVLLDGLLGTGVKLPLKAEMAAVLSEARNTLHGLDEPPFICAVDTPSGVDCDTGAAADECLAADLTVTMAAVKQGLLRFPAFGLAGEIEVVDIGLPADLPALTNIRRLVPDFELVAGFLPPRPPDAHKGTFGTALIVAGSVSYTGAAYLSAKAAYRVGAGLVTLAVPEPLHPALAGHLPEVTWIPLPHENGFISEAGSGIIAKNLDRATALLIGPGFGLEETTKNFISKLLDLKLPPLVVDADGLKLFAQIPDRHKKHHAPAILTPHPGEMSALTGLTVKQIQADREGVAAAFAKQSGHVAVLKGAFTVIAAPDGRVAVLPFASAALARAGTGDVLAGLIVGLRAQGVDAFEAAVAGAWIHARAGLTSLEVVGSAASVLAGDLLDSVNDVMAELSADL
jgi:ADP-dependent NAD(P)H-hydrate dehydratase / NAD(P)H-hydrate epimerase